jgi:hypothetical protein
MPGLVFVFVYVCFCFLFVFVFQPERHKPYRRGEACQLISVTPNENPGIVQFALRFVLFLPTVVPILAATPRFAELLLDPGEGQIKLHCK